MSHSIGGEAFQQVFHDEGDFDAFVDQGGIEALLTCVNNHLDSSDVCAKVCRTLIALLQSDNGRIQLLITSGSEAVVASVETRWPDNNQIQDQVRLLNGMFQAVRNLVNV